MLPNFFFEYDSKKEEIIQEIPESEKIVFFYRQMSDYSTKMWNDFRLLGKRQMKYL